MCDDVNFKHPEIMRVQYDKSLIQENNPRNYADQPNTLYRLLRRALVIIDMTREINSKAVAGCGLLLINKLLMFLVEFTEIYCGENSVNNIDYIT
jgi:hypothetical protein